MRQRPRLASRRHRPSPRCSTSPRYSGRNDLIVVSFSDELIQAFNAEDVPPLVALAPGIEGVAALRAAGVPPVPDVAAFQVPPSQNGIAVPEMLLNRPPRVRTPTPTATRSTSGRTGTSPTARRATPA